MLVELLEKWNLTKETPKRDNLDHTEKRQEANKQITEETNNLYGYRNW